MKNIAMATGVLICALLATLIILSGESRQLRYREEWTALHHAMERTMDTLTSQEGYRPADENQLVSFFLQNFLTEIDSDSRIKVLVYEADASCGLLDVEVTEYFQYPNGKEGQVSARKTMIIEEND